MEKECPHGALNLCFPTGGTVEGLANIRRRGWVLTQIKAGVTIHTGKLDDDGQPMFEAKYSGLHSTRHFFCILADQP